MVGFISRELLVGVVDLLEQRLEPEADVRAREPDRAAGGLEGLVDRFYISSSNIY